MKISLKFVPMCPIHNMLFQIMAWHRPGDKPLSEPMLASLLMHICVPRPQWFKVVDRCAGSRVNTNHVRFAACAGCKLWTRAPEFRRQLRHPLLCRTSITLYTKAMVYIYRSLYKLNTYRLNTCTCYLVCDCCAPVTVHLTSMKEVKERMVTSVLNGMHKMTSVCRKIRHSESQCRYLHCISAHFIVYIS